MDYEHTNLKKNCQFSQDTLCMVSPVKMFLSSRQDGKSSRQQRPQARLDVILFVIGHILELACNGGLCGLIFSHANHTKLFLMIFPRISLHCKLDPVQYREYEYDLLQEYLINMHLLKACKFNQQHDHIHLEQYLLLK